MNHLQASLGAAEFGESNEPRLSGFAIIAPNQIFECGTGQSTRRFGSVLQEGKDFTTVTLSKGRNFIFLH